MRLAILADPIDNQSAGVHVFTREMVMALIRNNPGHEIILVREKIDPTLTGVEQVAVPNVRLPIGFASVRLFFIIPFLLRKKRVDAVIEPAHFGPFNLPGKVKRITVIHDLTPLIFPHLHRWHSQMLQRIFLKRILHNTGLIIANSDHTAADICKTFPAVCGKVRRIYPGLRSDFGKEPEEGVLKKYNISTPYFLFVGTIEPRKRLDVLLEAYSAYASSHENPALLVIAGGRGWKSDRFFEMLQQHPFRNRIILTGYVETNELPQLYRSATALVYPSAYEGFGLPVVEAMHFGTPVITCRNSSLTEAGGDQAVYVETDNASQLAEALKSVENTVFNKEQLKKHASQFSWDRFAKEFYGILER